jgi:hypothetical protein
MDEKRKKRLNKVGKRTMKCFKLSSTSSSGLKLSVDLGFKRLPQHLGVFLIGLLERILMASSENKEQTR